MTTSQRKVRTKRGAIRRRDAIIRRIYHKLRGGTQYGVDIPTIRMCCPEEYAELQALSAAFKQLPE